MSNDALSVLQVVFGSIWSLFTSFKIPGTNVTPAAWGLFILFTVVFIKLIRRVTSDNVSNGGSDA